MKNVNVRDPVDPIKQTSSFLPWRVIHLTYPRETVEYRHLELQWTPFWIIKRPKISIKKKQIAHQGSSVNYEALCRELESVLNNQEAEGYQLTAIYPTHSGSYCLTKIPKQPYAEFLKKTHPSHYLHGTEALILVFRKK